MKHFILKTGLVSLSMVCLLVPIFGCGKNNIKQWAEPPAMQIDANKTYYAIFDTSLGIFKIELWAKDAPITVNSFVFLTQQGFYDGTVFHRIVQNFMIQGGDPDYKNTDINGPGYTIQDELPPKGNYNLGVLAMANAGPNTGGSQFFICTGNNAANLNSDKAYTQFGIVVEGMDVVHAIAAVDVSFLNDEFGKPKHPPVIHSITIEEF